MRKIIAGFAASLDGFIEGPNGEIDWIINDPGYFKEYSKQWKEIDAMLYGRKTYETVLKYATKQQTNPFKHMKHYVFSRTLEEVAPGYILQSGDLKKEIDELKKKPGKQIAVFGGALFLGSLINLDLVDELVIAVNPVLIGKGKSSFININDRKHFSLKAASTYPSGLVALTYERKN